MKRVYHTAFPDVGMLEEEHAEVMIPAKVRPGVRACTECGATSTPQWRQGPAGPQTLCNACGVRYSRLMRKGSKGNRRRPPLQLHEDVSDDSVSDDTSKGTTIMLMSPPANSPAGSPPRSHPFQLASLTPFPATMDAPMLPAGLRPRRRGSYGLVTTGLPAGLPISEHTGLAPVSNPTAAPAVTRLVSLRASSSSGLLRLGSSHAMNNLPALSCQQESLQPGQQQLEPEDTDCEAALNLLSMAAGHVPDAAGVQDREGPAMKQEQHAKEQQVKVQPTAVADVRASTAAAAASPATTLLQQEQCTCSPGSSSNTSAAATQLLVQQQQLAAVMQERRLQQLPPAGAAAASGTVSQLLRGDAMQALLARMGSSREEAAVPAAQVPEASGPHTDGMQALMSRLNGDEQRTLSALCNQFDTCFQEMVAAQAACEAVAQILRSKQEAARMAQLAARAAAQMLMLKATELQGHGSAQPPQAEPTTVAARDASRATSAAAGVGAAQRSQMQASTAAAVEPTIAAPAIAAPPADAPAQ